MHEHLAQKMTLAELARFAGTSVRTLSHLLVSRLGFPPMRYLIELRLNHAMKLLRHTDHTIEQNADECGFPNRYYFTRILVSYRKPLPPGFEPRAGMCNKAPPPRLRLDGDLCLPFHE